MTRCIFLIAKETFINLLRHRMLSIHLIFILISLGLFNLFGHFSTSSELEYRMIQDVGLSVISLFGLLLSLFIASSTIREDLSRKTAYAVLTLPIARWQYYLGKFAGTMLSVIFNTVIMISIFAIGIGIKFHMILPSFFWVVFFMSMEFAIITALTLMFSLSDSTVMSFSFTVFLVIMGNLADYVKHLAAETGIYILDLVTRLSYYVIPNFGYFNIKTRVLKGLAIPSSMYLWAGAYVIIYVAMTVVLAVCFIEKRDL